MDDKISVDPHRYSRADLAMQRKVVLERILYADRSPTRMIF